MVDKFPLDSVGLIEPQTMQFDDELKLECGRKLSAYQMAVETYGKLNDQRDNAIWICHADLASGNAGTVAAPTSKSGISGRFSG